MENCIAGKGQILFETKSEDDAGLCNELFLSVHWIIFVTVQEWSIDEISLTAHVIFTYNPSFDWWLFRKLTSFVVFLFWVIENWKSILSAWRAIHPMSNTTKRVLLYPGWFRSKFKMKKVIAVVGRFLLQTVCSTTVRQKLDSCFCIGSTLITARWSE